MLTGSRLSRLGGHAGAAVLVALLAVVAVVTVVAPASAAFTSLRSASLTVQSLTVQPATGVTATADCLLTPKVTLTWTPPSAPAGGYVIYQQHGSSGWVQVATASGDATSARFAFTIWSDSTFAVKTQDGSWSSTYSAASNTVFCLL